MLLRQLPAPRRRERMERARLRVRLLRLLDGDMRVGVRRLDVVVAHQLPGDAEEHPAALHLGPEEVAQAMEPERPFPPPRAYARQSAWYRPFSLSGSASRPRMSGSSGDAASASRRVKTVSYTHLTLPTSYSV